MKLALRLLALISLALCAGCALPDISKFDSKIPNGDWQDARVEVAGKFTATTLSATGSKVDGKWVRGELHFSHSNPWVTKATLDLKVQPNEVTK